MPYDDEYNDDCEFDNGDGDHDHEEDFADREDQEEEEFADPDGNSALRAASASNPRNLPCPTCGSPDRLTPKDVALGYQCDSCADRAERGGEY